jgi:hypothetical protein
MKKVFVLMIVLCSICRSEEVFRADLNCDCKVNIFDLNIVAMNWLGPYFPGDVNKDGFVDLKDFTVMANEWLNECSYTNYYGRFNYNYGLNRCGTLSAPDNNSVLDPDNADFTISFWLRWATRPAMAIILDHTAWASNKYWDGYLVLVPLNQNKIRLALFSNENLQTFDHSLTTMISGWNHLAVTVNRSTNKVLWYLNGTAGTQQSLTLGSIEAFGEDLNISGWNSDLDNIRFYKGKCLSAAEVATLYGSESSNCRINSIVPIQTGWYTSFDYGSAWTTVFPYNYMVNWIDTEAVGTNMTVGDAYPLAGGITTTCDWGEYEMMAPQQEMSMSAEPVVDKYVDLISSLQRSLEIPSLTSERRSQIQTIIENLQHAQTH